VGRKGPLNVAIELVEQLPQVASAAVEIGSRIGRIDPQIPRRGRHQLSQADRSLRRNCSLIPTTFLPDESGEKPWADICRGGGLSERSGILSGHWGRTCVGVCPGRNDGSAVLVNNLV